MALPPIIDPFPDHTAALYAALGKGLSRWQHVETALYLVTLAFMETDHETGSRIFFHIKSAENKLALADRFAFYKLDQRTWAKLWKPIADDARAAIVFRNCLAHFQIFTLEPNGGGMQPPSQYRVAVSYNNLDEHAHHKEPVKALSVETIDHNADELRYLAYKIIYFLIDRVPQLEQLTERLPPDLRQWLDSFRKTTRPPEFPLPRGSSRT